MSDSESGSGAGRREVAYRLFAAEFDDATVSYSESEEERAPNYVVSPTGGRVNRLFLVGVLTELERVNEDMLRARIVDPTGPFVVYAGQYQPDALSFLERAEPPAFLAVTGKARTFQPEDSDRVYTSVRPESISEVDAETRDRWVVQTAEQTLHRVATMAAAKQTGLAGDRLRETLESEGVDGGLAHGIVLALERYGTTGEYLAAVRETALDAARVVAGEREEVEPYPLAPGEGGEADLDALAGEVGAGVTTEAAGEPIEAAGEAAQPAQDSTETVEPDEPTGSEAPAEPTGTETDSGEPEVEPGPETDQVAETTAETVEPSASGTAAAETETETETDAAEEELGDFEPGEFDLDEEEREEIEEEYGTEFETGNEVGEPGEAGIEPEAPETETEPEASDAGAEAETTAATAEPEAESAAGTEAELASESDSGPEDEEMEAVEEPEVEEVEPEPEGGGLEEPESEAGADEAPEDVDVDEAVMATMEELADGEGADREELIATVAEEYGFDPAEVEDAIQDALMSGQCYEPDEGKLKPI